MSGDFEALMERFRSRLDAELVIFLKGRRQATAAQAPEAEALLDRLEDLVFGGGKRLRPALVYFGYVACEGSAEARILPLAMATELLHTYLLIHDDIMDHADTRRGKPSVHAFFETHHGQRGYTGDAREYGRSMAILAGDLAHTYADQLFTSVDSEPERRLRLHRIYYAMCREVIDGQFLELHMGIGGDPPEEDLRRVLRLKSGLYTVERPLQMGAVLAGADEVRCEALSRFGGALGEAFQLRDDVLGTFGDPAAVGKPVGGDLREGKFTLLFHHALQMSADDGAARLRRGLGRADLPDDEVLALCDLLRECGALEAVDTMIERRMLEARTTLQGLDLAPAGKAFLSGLIDYLGRRSH